MNLILIQPNKLKILIFFCKSRKRLVPLFFNQDPVVETQFQN